MGLAPELTLQHRRLQCEGFAWFKKWTASDNFSVVMMKTKYKCKKNNNIKADNPKIFSGKTPQISYFYANKSENICI